MYTLHKTVCTQQIVSHAADRCAVILVPAFNGKCRRNEDEEILLCILYRYIFFGLILCTLHCYPLYCKLHLYVLYNVQCTVIHCQLHYLLYRELQCIVLHTVQGIAVRCRVAYSALHSGEQFTLTPVQCTAHCYPLYSALLYTVHCTVHCNPLLRPMFSLFLYSNESVYIFF